MDVLKYCDSGGSIPSNTIDSKAQEPSMTDIVHSMRDYLLTPTPDSLDPLDLCDQNSSPEARQSDHKPTIRTGFKSDITNDSTHFDDDLSTRRDSLVSDSYIY